MFGWVRRFLHQASLAYPAGNNIYIHIIHILSIFFFAKISKDPFFFLLLFLNDVIIPKNANANSVSPGLQIPLPMEL